MRYMRQWNTYVVVLALLMVQLMAATVTGTPPYDVAPVAVHVSHVPGDADEVVLNVIVGRPHTCSETTMELETTGLLKVTEGTTRTVSLHKDTSFETTVTL
jgi:hypothetical protein